MNYNLKKKKEKKKKGLKRQVKWAKEFKYQSLRTGRVLKVRGVGELWDFPRGRARNGPYYRGGEPHLKSKVLYLKLPLNYETRNINFSLIIYFNWNPTFSDTTASIC